MTDTQTILNQINRVVLILGGLQERIPAIIEHYDNVGLSYELDSLVQCYQKSIEFDECCGAEGVPIGPGRVCGRCRLLGSQIDYLSERAAEGRG